MTALSLGKGAYKRLTSPEIRLVNRMFEANPTNASDQVSLIPRPGLLTWKAAMAAPTRAMYLSESSVSGGIWAVIGTDLRGYPQNGGFYAIGTGSIPGTEPCSMACLTVGIPGGSGYDSILLIANGTALYRYNLNIDQVTFPDNAGVTSIDAIASRFVASRANTGRFYWSDVNSSTFQSLNYATAENRTDILICAKAVGDELWLFGSTSVEIWVPTGDSNLPFQRISGRTFGIGCASRASVCFQNGSVFWVGGTERRVYMSTPNPQPISDPSVEERLRMAVASDLNAFSYSIGGHVVYVLNMGTQGSMAYDVSTGQWHEWISRNDSSFRGRYSAPFGDGRYIVGDTTGRFNFLDLNTWTDNGDPIVSEWTGFLPSNEKIRCDNVILRCSVGNAAGYADNPQVSLSYSDDDGRTFSDARPSSLGHRGDYRAPVAWYRLGLMKRPGRLFKFTCAENLPVTVLSASVNERF